MRDRIARERRKLKGTSVVVADDLTPANARLFQEMKEVFGVRKTWTRNGQVHVKTSEGVKVATAQNKEELKRGDNVMSSTPIRPTQENTERKGVWGVWGRDDGDRGERRGRGSERRGQGFRSLNNTWTRHTPDMNY